MRALAIIVMIVTLARTSHAECPADRAPKTLPIARGSIVVDGVLDDATWQHACFADDFEQQQPVFGAKPTHPVRVAVAIEGTTLYVGARMWSAGPGDIDDALTQRDDTSQAERFIVSIDPSHTRRIAYSFAVTARGVRADWIHTDDSEGNRDASWDPVWVGKAKILADGWSAEMAIPLSQLRLPREPAASWGIDFDWYIPHRNEDVFWRPVPLDRTAWASFFGELVDLPPVRPGIALELLPYISTRLAVDESIAAPLSHRWAGGIEAGLDAKLRPLPGLTVTATVNPDFGQVDADPAFVNLTQYEVQLPEKRPFFVENNSLLADAPAQYFYSRRIGGLPLRLPTADTLDLPQQVRILGAVAAGGYVEPHTQIAALAAVSDETSADAIVNGDQTSLVVSPLTAWGAARVEHQLDASVIGATATFVERALAGTDLQDLLAQTAFAGGVDGKLRTHDGEYELDPYAGVTGVFGTATAITTIEETSTHLFQRPDEPYLHVDADAHRMLGWHSGVAAQKRAGFLQGAASIDLMSPGFELNDLGALAAADAITASIKAGRYVTVPTPHVFSWDVGGAASQAWNFGGLRRPASVQAFADVTLASFWYGGVGWSVHPPGDDDLITRGGPRMLVGWSSALTAYASTPSGRAQQLSANLEVDVSPTLQQGVIGSVTLASRVASALRLDLVPSLTVVENHRQYIATVTDEGGGDDTYGARYVFGHLERKEAALQLRLTWSLSPELVMTLYAQPFVSVGRYDEVGELAAAGSDVVRSYATAVHDGANRMIVDGTDAFSIPEPDYSIASLRSTAVLRWEPRPGTTLYVVWQQARGGVAWTVAQPLHGAVPEVFTESAIHTLAVKLAYWFG